MRFRLRTLLGNAIGCFTFAAATGAGGALGCAAVCLLISLVRPIGWGEVARCSAGGALLLAPIGVIVFWLVRREEAIVRASPPGNT